MQTIRPIHHLFAAVSILCPLLPAQGQDEENLPAAEDLRAGGDDKMRYFLVGPRTDAVMTKAPKDGFKLLLVLPGGNGSAEFATFGRRIAANATDEQWLVAILVAPTWNEKQAKELVWPTRTDKADGMKFATEDFIAAVVRDVEQRHPVDPATVFTLTWSSSGPAAYATSLDPKIGVTGSFIAMSVWKPDELPKLDKAKGHAYWLLHSPQDFIPIAMPKQAMVALKKAGAAVEMAEYEGGHGWKGDVYGMMRKGIDWLLQHAQKPTAERVTENKKARAALQKGGDPDARGGDK